MTAWRWTAADGTTGRLTGPSAVALTRRLRGITPPCEVPKGSQLIGWASGAADMASAYKQRSTTTEMNELWHALLRGPVTLELGS